MPLRVTTAIDVDALEAATTGQWAAPPARLAEDVGRTLVAMEWGVGHVHVYEDETDSPPLAVHAMALLADNRQALIVGWQVDEQTVAVAVQVGNFGDPQEEARFLDALQKTMLGPAIKHRTWRFKLPH